MFLLLLLLVVGFAGPAKSSESKLARSQVAYYTDDTFAIYEPWNISGKMTFVFKTLSQRGLLFYQDDGEYAYMKLQVKEDALELEVRLSDKNCTKKKIEIEGIFADSEWHRVVLDGNPAMFNLSVDGSFTATVRCMQESSSFYFTKLYVRSFPRSRQLAQDLVDADAFREEYRPQRLVI